MIKAVCFDLDVVYFTKDGMDGFKEFFFKKGFSLEQVNHVFFKSEEMLRFKKGLITENKYWEYVRTSLNVDYSNEEFKNILISNYKINKEIDEFRQLLRDNGVKTLICSNNFKTRVEVLNEKFNFLDNFDLSVFSYQVNLLKPDKRIFEKLIELSGINPNEIIYSDDNEDKLLGATELDINTFVFTDFNHFKNEIYKLGLNF